MISQLMLPGAIIGALMGYALLPVIAKKVGVSVPPFTFMAITMSILALISMSAAFIFESPLSLNKFVVPDLVLLGTFAIVNFVSFGLLLFILQHVFVAQYQVLAVIVPLLSAVYAYFLLGETVTIWFFAAVPLIGVGLYLALLKG